MADLTFTPFSDVDDLVVIRKAAWQDPDCLAQIATSLARLARRFQDIDPLQHHGHFVITEFDLRCYDQSILPLNVIRDSVCITGNPELSLRVRDDKSGFLRNAAGTLKSMRQTMKHAARRGGLNAFALKGLVGEIAILPAYLFQAQGEMLTKPQAIARAGEIYSPAALPALEWATRVRAEFAPLVHNARTRLLSKAAKYLCPRRHQAEALFRRYAAWAPNGHDLGLRPPVVKAIENYIQESSERIAAIEQKCASSPTSRA